MDNPCPYTAGWIIQVDNPCPYTAGWIIQVDNLCSYTVGWILQVDNPGPYTVGWIIQVDHPSAISLYSGPEGKKVTHVLFVSENVDKTGRPLKWLISNAHNLNGI